MAKYLGGELWPSSVVRRQFLAKVAEFCSCLALSQAAGAVVFVVREAQNWKVLRW
jgi:hypothetical protein